MNSPLKYENRRNWNFCTKLFEQNHSYLFFQDGFESILDQLTANDPEDVQYFYHSDHLGSSSFITDASGTVDQHLQYLPFGEPWIDQRTQNNIRFTFSGKEKDEETGYNYFGARYYNSDISIWLSVDPLSDERSWLTGYNYVQNNPLKLIDPTGMLDEPPTKAGKNNGEIYIDTDTGTKFEWNSNHNTWYGTDWNLDAVDVAENRNSQNWLNTGFGIASDILGGAGVLNGLAGYNAKMMSEHVFKYAQRVGDIIESASEITRDYQTRANNVLSITKSMTKYLGYTSGALIIGDVFTNSEVKASNVINATMTAISLTGWGTAAACIWFTADLGAKLFTGKSFSERIDSGIGDALLDW